MDTLIAAFNAVYYNGALSMALNAVVFSTAALCVKLLEGRIGPLEIVAVRSGVSAILVAATIQHARKHVHNIHVFGQPDTRAWLAVRAAAGAVAMTTYFFAIQYLPLGDAVTIMFLNVVLTPAGAALLGYEKLRWQLAVGSVFCFGGVLLISHPPFLYGHEDWDAHRLAGVYCALVSAALSSTSFISIRVIGQREHALIITQWFHVAAGSAAFVSMFIVGISNTFVMPEPRGFLLLGAIVLFSYVGQILLSRGFQLLKPSVAASINLTQVIHAHLLQWVFLHDGLSLFSLVGSGLIGLGVAVVILSSPDGTAAEPSAARVTEPLLASETPPEEMGHGAVRSARVTEPLLAPETPPEDMGHGGARSARFTEALLAPETPPEDMGHGAGHMARVTEPVLASETPPKDVEHGSGHIARLTEPVLASEAPPEDVEHGAGHSVAA